MNQRKQRRQLAAWTPRDEILRYSCGIANRQLRDLPTAFDMAAVIRQLAAEGRVITTADLAVLSPYRTGRVKRFGEYAIDGLDTPPEAFDPRLAIDRAAAGEAA